MATSSVLPAAQMEFSFKKASAEETMTKIRKSDIKKHKTKKAEAKKASHKKPLEDSIR